MKRRGIIGRDNRGRKTIHREGKGKLCREVVIKKWGTKVRDKRRGLIEERNNGGEEKIEKG
jgi:hypothetical protein